MLKKSEKKEAEESTEKTDETIHDIYNPNRRSSGRRQTRQMRYINNLTYIVNKSVQKSVQASRSQ